MNNKSITRMCPICGSSDRVEIMKFSAEQLAEINKSYDIEYLKKAIKGIEDLVTYSSCQNCGMIYSDTYWSNNVLNSIYKETINHKYSKEKSLSIDKRIQLHKVWVNILSILKLDGMSQLGKIKLADYGCGWGDFLDVVYGYGVECMGYDEDLIKIELAKKRGHYIAQNINEFEQFGPVDIFIMNSVLEHIQDVNEIMLLIKKMLKPGGLFVFTVMDFREKYIKKNITQLNYGKPALTKVLNPIEHVNIFNFKTVMTFLYRNNFKLVATNKVMSFFNISFIRAKLNLLHFINIIENVYAKINTSKKMGITVYAQNLNRL